MKFTKNFKYKVPHISKIVGQTYYSKKINREVFFMCNGVMDFIKCAAIGLLAGTAIGAFFCCRAKEATKDRGIKSKAKKSLCAMEVMVNDVQDMFKKD